MVGDGDLSWVCVALSISLRIGSPVIVSGLPFPAGCTHSNVEDAVSAEYKMALLNCLVMRVGFMVMCILN